MKILFLCLLFFVNSFVFAQNTVEVYTLDGCERCAYVVEQLKKSGVKFADLPVERESNSELMMERLAASDTPAGEITMPVVVFNSKTYANIPDLEALCNEIVSLAGTDANDENVAVAKTSKQTQTPETSSADGDKEPENMKGILERHNFFRNEVGIQNLVWSNELAAYAQEWANELAARGCQMNHRPRDGKWKQRYGENIYWAQGMNPTPSDVVNSWGEEKAYFDFEKLACKGEWYTCGHYTQIIWENTTKVGCAFARCNNNQVIWVCNYNPPGNYIGQKPFRKK
jgi:glutaredoxin